MSAQPVIRSCAGSVENVAADPARDALYDAVRGEVRPISALLGVDAPEPDPGVGEASFRAALGRLPTGVTVVTCIVDGVDHAMTAGAVTSISLDPPLVLVSVGRIARFHAAILAADGWAISVLPAEARDTAAWFATRGRPLAGQLDGHPYDRAPSTGAAVFRSALSTVECRPYAVYDGGDHSIVVGRVIEVSVRRPDAVPLVHFRGRYHTVGDEA
jgi:flavin reductase (DIM6/NTAB) family NADH-FMN oxidoreductase RutF